MSKEQQDRGRSVMGEIVSADTISVGITTPTSHEEQDWYHGLLPRADINSILINDGDFIVRKSHRNTEKDKEKDSVQLVLSAKYKGKCHHWQIAENKDGSVILDEKKFANVCDMINQLRSKKLPVSANCPAILINPIMKQDWELRHDQICLGKMLGEGAFGGVYKAVFCLKSKKLAVAVKVNKGNDKMSTRSMIEDVCKEARIMRQYQHANVVSFYGVCVEKEPIMLVMELANQGALDSFLKNSSSKDEITLRDKLKYSFDASKGLEYLHQNGCIHRDVAARNFLVHKGIVKITDFGLSKQLSDHAHKYKLKDLHQKLPIRWLAPEVIVTATYSFKSDVFSFGILLWEIFMDGAIPYPGMTLAEVSKEVRKGYRMSPPDKMPMICRNIMTAQCWPQNPADRDNMMEIRQAIEGVLEGRQNQMARSAYVRYN
ncbi:unnamed protein product [Caenorhabditis angaria]|uniref:Tyrosine-protein kinase n=1 Tax=Caenorhabditis angaria TaxID=860376 RepID=A0A9P1IRA8_9PELO|nr:unnamed protein product [Caenorhabditis angaria]